MPDTAVKKVVTDDEIYRARLKRTLTESSVDKIDNEKGFIAFKALFTNKTREQLKSAGDRDLKSLRAEYNEYLKHARTAKDQDERAGLLEAALGKINNKSEEIDKKLFSDLPNHNNDPDVDRYNDAIRKLNGRSQYVEQDYGTRYYKGAKRSYEIKGGKLIIEDLPVFGQREGKKWVYERKEGENTLTVTRTDYSFEYLKQGGRDGDVLVDKQGGQILAARQIGEPGARKIILAPFKTVNAEGKPLFERLAALPGMTQEAKAKIAVWNRALEKSGKTETVQDKEITYKRVGDKIVVTQTTYDLNKPKNNEGIYPVKEKMELTLTPGKFGLEYTEEQTINGKTGTEKGLIKPDGEHIIQQANPNKKPPEPEERPKPPGETKIGMAGHLDRMLRFEERRERSITGDFNIDLKKPDNSWTINTRDGAFEVKCHAVKGIDNRNYPLRNVYAYLINVPGGQQLPVISEAPLSDPALHNVYTAVTTAPPQLFKHLLTKNFSSDSPAIYIRRDLGQIRDTHMTIGGEYVDPAIRIRQDGLSHEKGAREVLWHEGMHHADRRHISMQPDNAFTFNRSKQRYGMALEVSDYINDYARTNPKEDFAVTGQFFLEHMRTYLSGRGKTMADLPNLDWRDIDRYFAQRRVSEAIRGKIRFVYDNVFKKEER